MSLSVFKKWTSAVQYLNEKIKSNRLIAGRNIQLENTGNGVRIHGSAENTPSDGESYNGYFKVIQTADDKIKIVDGKNESLTFSGKINVNYFPVSVGVQEFTITESGFVYLQCELTGSPAATGATGTIVFSAVEKESISGDYYDLISRVDFDDDKVSDYNRENVNKNIVMGGGCGTV